MGTDLKLALHNIIKGHYSVSYDSLWTHYESTDKRPDNTVWCMYSGIHFTNFGFDQGGPPGEVGGYLSREHSWPKSWWGGDTNDAYTDLFHVYPADAQVNGQKGVKPLGEVGDNYENWGISKIGDARPGLGYSGEVFEPADNYKGDFARGYFYFVVRYLTGSGALNCADSPMVKSNGHELENWAVDLLIEWHESDPPSQIVDGVAKEINRNEAVYEIQNNRNPFIDHPEWVKGIWNPVERSVEVLISPSEDNAPFGHELNYQVMVTNTGFLSDNYDLSVTDNAVPSWNPTLADNLFENVSSGDNFSTTLRVTIPESESAGVKDNITVTATSQENNLVKSNASCQALAVGIDRSLNVTISPAQKNGTPGKILEYTVGVRNEGNVSDNYELDASDDIDPSWNPTFADNLIENVAPGEEKTATLSVTIPDNDNLIGVTDTITITATSQENTSMSDSEICYAEAVESPVGGIFHPADRERLEEQGEKMLTTFVIPLAALITVLAFAVWWRKRE